MIYNCFFTFLYKEVNPNIHPIIFKSNSLKWLSYTNQKGTFMFKKKRNKLNSCDSVNALYCPVYGDTFSSLGLSDLEIGEILFLHDINGVRVGIAY